MYVSKSVSVIGHRPNIYSIFHKNLMGKLVCICQERAQYNYFMELPLALLPREH